MEQWTQGFENLYCSASQIVPRRVLIVPHEMSVKIRSERWLANVQFHNKAFFFVCTSLCGQRSAKKPTSIACWTATLFLLAQKKLGKKMLCHMAASRRESHFSILANVCRWLNMEIEQLANLKRTLRILANEWLVQWFQGFKNIQLFARQIVPRRNLIVPHEMSVKIRRERRLLIANLRYFIKTSEA